MKRLIRFGFLLLLALLTLPVVLARQDEALDLPADLYVLLNDGMVQRYGVGASGVTQVSPAGVFVTDFGVDDRGARLAYRTEQGLYTIDLTIPNSAPFLVEGTAAGVPPYRGEGDTVAFSPGFSEIPGAAIAYTTLEGLRVAFLGDTTPSFQTFTDGLFTDLSWSPTGRYLAAESDQNIWWIYRRDGNSLALTSIIVSSFGTSWVSATEIVFAPSEGGLKIMNLAAANQQTDLLDASVEYRYPILTSQDTLDFFGRVPANVEIPAGFGVLLRLRRGAQQIETAGNTPIELAGLRWLPGGSLMLAFQGGVLAVFDPSSGFGFPLPIENVVAYDWGPLIPPEQRPTTEPLPPDQPGSGSPITPDAQPTSPPDATPLPLGTAVGMNLPAALFFIAQDGFGVAQVWQLATNGRAPARLTFADVDVNDFAASTDARTIYYSSESTIWLQRADIGFPIGLQDLTSFAPAQPDLSPDGTQLAYTDEELGVSLITIDTVTPANSEVSRLLPNIERDGERFEYAHPRWSPQGDRLLVEVGISPIAGGDSRFAVGVYDMASAQLYTTAPLEATDPRTANARWLSDGRILAHADASASGIAPGYYVYDFIGEGAAPTLAAALPADTVIRADVELRDGVIRALVASAVDPGAPLRVIDVTLADGSISEVVSLITSIGSPRFSPDGAYIAGFQRAESQIDRGALLVISVSGGRQTLINPVDGLAGEVWGVGF